MRAEASVCATYGCECLSRKSRESLGSAMPKVDTVFLEERVGVDQHLGLR